MPDSMPGIGDLRASNRGAILPTKSLQSGEEMRD